MQTIPGQTISLLLDAGIEAGRVQPTMEIRVPTRDQHEIWKFRLGLDYALDDQAELVVIGEYFGAAINQRHRTVTRRTGLSGNQTEEITLALEISSTILAILAAHHYPRHDRAPGS